MATVMRIKGFKPADEKWQKMKAIWDACLAVGIDPPKEVYAFFEYASPDRAGVLVSEDVLRNSGAVEKHREEGEMGYVIDVTKLPAGVTTVRVYNVF